MIYFNNDINDFDGEGIPFSASPNDNVPTTLLFIFGLMETKKKSNFRAILNYKNHTYF